MDFKSFSDQLELSISELDKQIETTTDYSSTEYIELGQKLKQVTTQYDTIKEYINALNEQKELLELKDDPELGATAASELIELEKKLPTLEEKAKLALLPINPNDMKSVVLEIRAGAGGDESSIFASDMLRTYQKFLEPLNLGIEVLSSHPSSVGGYKEVSIQVNSSSEWGAYQLLQYEAGVHRVQRVPDTESQGRVHTSTITIAVMPVAEEKDIEINDSDLRIDVFRSSGNGGQSVNTTDSAVRITYLPDNIVVTCQDEKSQLKNKIKAMNILRSRLLAYQKEKEEKEAGAKRLSQIGSGDRSEKIRTYNYPQERITDHRINKSWQSLTQTMNGDFMPIWEDLNYYDQQDQLRAISN